MYYQRYTAKRFLRAYHGDHLPEGRFKRWYLPVDLPSYVNDNGEGSSNSNSNNNGGLFSSIAKSDSSGSGSDSAVQLPVSSLMVREVERRLDTAVFRSCFARSIYEARAMVLAGKVTLNGARNMDPGALLNPGDLFTMDADSIPMLSDELAKKYADRQAKKKAEKQKPAAGVEATEQEAATTGSAEEQPAAAVEAAETSNTEAETKAEAKAEAQAQAQAEAQAETETKEASTSEEWTSEEAAPEPKTEEADSPTSSSPSSTPTPKAEPSSRPASPSSARQLAPGEKKFTLPGFAAPFLFVPPYLEVSFTTCSTIYLRHPTLSKRTYTLPSTGTTRTEILSDIPSPYDARGEFFNLAWEHYSKNSPRIRSDLRRLREEAKTGRNGIESSRALDEYKKMIAKRRGWFKQSSVYTEKAYENRKSKNARGRRIYGHKVGHHYVLSQREIGGRGLKGAVA